MGTELSRICVCASKELNQIVKAAQIKLMPGIKIVDCLSVGV